MKKSVVYVENGEIICSKAFLSKARVYGTDEYQRLRTIKNDNPDCKITVKETNGKRTYKGLSYDCMVDYIKLQPNAYKRLEELECVRAIAKTKNAGYPFVKQWFLSTFPSYTEGKATDEEISSAERALQDYRTSTATNSSVRQLGAIANTYTGIPEEVEKEGLAS